MTTKKSGANLKLSLTGTTYDATHCGTRTVGVAQVALSTSIPCFEVLLEAASSNGAVVFVGNIADGCYVELAAGATVTIPINDLAKVAVRAANGTQTVNWIAMI